MTVLLVLLLFGSAMAAGYGLNVLFGKLHSTDATEGASVGTVLGPAGTVGVFFLALVLFGAAGSFTETGKLIKQEAAVMDNLYEAAEYVPDESIRQRFHAATVCYALAVAGPEWVALGKGETSTVPSNWTGTGEFGIRKALLDLTPAGQGFSLVLAQDQKRGDLRSDRVAKLTPSTPDLIFWFLIVLIAISMGGVAFSIPRERNTPQIASLAIVLIVYTALMATVYTLDRPFSGLLSVAPTAMKSTAADIEADYKDEHRQPLPCDAQGNPRATS